ncbi:MAG: cation transporter [Clostridia bacterium]|nr:cation transporter [Clostridia bacterium]MBP3503419.1 cation transporter [Clostridia bacterium]
MKKVYSIEGIDCANCATKVENKINKLKGINDATLNFMTSKLSIEFDSSDENDVKEIIEEVKRIVAKMEPDAKLR